MKIVTLWLLALCLLVPVSASGGFTLFVRPQVSPQHVTVQGATGPESRKNPGPAPAYPATVGRLLFRPASFSIYSSSAASRTELWEDSSGTATDADILAALPGLRAKITDAVKEIRKEALSRITTDNAAVLAIYDENYRAARAVMDGQGATTYTKDGRTATDYLTEFGARLGMAAGAYAAWLVSQNQQIGVVAGRVEDEYLRLAYGAIPAESSVARLLAYPDEYRRYCGL